MLIGVVEIDLSGPCHVFPQLLVREESQSIAGWCTWLRVHRRRRCHCGSARYVRRVARKHERRCLVPQPPTSRPRTPSVAHKCPQTRYPDPKPATLHETEVSPAVGYSIEGGFRRRKGPTGAVVECVTEWDAPTSYRRPGAHSSRLSRRTPPAREFAPVFKRFEADLLSGAPLRIRLRSSAGESRRYRERSVGDA